MFGGKLRAWMEAVRPKKKQHRKEKQRKNTTPVKDRPNTNSQNHVTWKSGYLLESEPKETKRDSSASRYVSKPDKHHGSDSHKSRYSTINLSSPESAYSTGYSTDATSPGGVVLEYPVNTGAKKRTDSAMQNKHSPHPHRKTRSPKPAKFKSFPEQTPTRSSSPRRKARDRALLEEQEGIIIANPQTFFGQLPEPTALMSPRQRNRIRTNPWLPGGSNSAVASPMPLKKDASTPMAYRKNRNSPIQNRYLSPVTHRKSLSSSSCSSLSAAQIHSFEHKYPKSLSDEDDCTLNEMMGKYDESYVYEKETDILSDSDPTDCESDIDTGQDGGDEEENGDEEFDYIDNGSYVETDYNAGNTGHCLYIIPSDMQRKRSSRRRTTKKVKEASSKKRKSSSNKKNHKSQHEKIRHSSFHQDGSKSAGATPVSIRKSILKSSQPKIEEDYVKKRSNSVSLHRDVTNYIIDKRDREADMKYKELIGQAEQIIKTMNINGLSPRRVPGPTNKRVELLRSAECSKPEVLFMNRPNDETSIPNSNIAPSTVTYKNTRFSPKKNHITNFITNHSPVLVRKDGQGGHSPLPLRSMLPEEGHQSPLSLRKHCNQLTPDIVYENPQELEYDVRKDGQGGHSPLPRRRMLPEEGHQSPLSLRKHCNQLTPDIVYENPQELEYDVRKDGQGGHSPLPRRRMLPEEGHQSPLSLRKHCNQLSPDIFYENTQELEYDVRKDGQGGHSPLPLRRTLPDEDHQSPLSRRKHCNQLSPDMFYEKTQVLEYDVHNDGQGGHSPLPLRRMLPEEGHQSPLNRRKHGNQLTADIFYEKTQVLEYDVNPPAIYSLEVNPNDHCLSSPVGSRKIISPKSILHKPESNPTADLLSSGEDQAIALAVESSSSEEDGFKKPELLSKSCPQSEPMRRKNYTCKSVAFNLGEEMPENAVGSAENLRHQVLLNTMHSLKRNLEDHSASLRFTYNSTQNMYNYL